ncbi:MAG: hypothetical protein ACKOYN_07135, partial [Planctomycetota bacterium]
LERATQGGDPAALRFTKPALPNELDFSLSGLKTKLLYEIRGVPTGRGDRARFERDHTALSAARKADLAASVQHAAFAQVLDRLSRAHALHAPRSLLVGGGVVSNRTFRRELAAWCLERDVALVVPEPAYCVDNAAMIAGYAQLRRAAGDQGDDLAVPAEPVSLLARGLQRPRRSA